MLAFVARMRQFCERQVPERIHLLLRGRRIRGIDPHITVPDRLDDYRRMQHVGMGLNQMEILRKGFPVPAVKKANWGIFLISDMLRPASIARVSSSIGLSPIP